MKIDNKNISKNIKIIIGILVLVGIIGTATYAIFNWKSTDTNVSANMSCFDGITGTSTTISGDDMILLDEKEILDATNNTITYRNGMVYVPLKVTRDNTCNTDMYYEVVLTITTLSEAYRNGSLKYKIIGDMSSYTAEQFNNPLNEELEYIDQYYEDIIKGGTITLYEKNINPNTEHLLALVFYLDGNLVSEGASDLDFTANVEVIANQMNKYDAVQHITSLYSNAAKSTATVNDITYNLAPSVGLMNDRHASMSVDADAGDIRYYGINPNNYVWLGDTYQTDYTFNMVLHSVSYTRNAGDKKLWRIIGVFDGKIKLMQNDPVSTQRLSWDTSISDINSGYGINQWGPSGNYEGSDLMRLLNPGYEWTSINNSLYWNKGTGTVYTGRNNAVTENISFVNTGLTSMEKNLIDTATWYLGAQDKIYEPADGYYGNVYADSQYISERQSNILGKICSSDSTCDDTVVRTATWEGKVGLMYASDYAYAADLSKCNKRWSEYNNYDYETISYPCLENSWIRYAYDYLWTISPFAQEQSSNVVRNDSTLVIPIKPRNNYNDKMAASVRGVVYPVVYLKTGVSIIGGNGSESRPYILKDMS